MSKDKLIAFLIVLPAFIMVAWGLYYWLRAAYRWLTTRDHS